MRRTPITLGILSIVFGSLVALSNVLKLAVSALTPTLFGHMGTLMKNLPQRPGQPDPALVMARTAEAMHQLAPYNDALTGGKLALSIAWAAASARAASISWPARSTPSTCAC